MPQHTYFMGPRTRHVTLTLRLPIWKELPDAFDGMRARQAQDQQFSIEKMCAEIIESWAAERRIIRAEHLSL